MCVCVCVQSTCEQINCVIEKVIILFVVLFRFSAFASGQLSIVHFPKSLAFKGTEPLAAAALGDVFAAASGASIEGSSEWSALSIRTPFDLPRGNFLLYLQGAQHSPIATKNTYELTGAGSFESVTNALNRVAGSDYTDLAAGTGDLEKITWTALKPESRPDEKAFLQAIASLYALTEQLTSTPTADLPVFWAARLQSSQSLTTTGSTVSALAEAKKIEAAAIDELIAALKKSYGYDVLIAVAASDETDEPTNVRHKRQATPDISENHVHVTQLVSVGHMMLDVC